MNSKVSGNRLKILTAAVTLAMMFSFSMAFISQDSVSSSAASSPFVSYSQPVLKDQWVNYTTSTGPAPMSNATMTCFGPSSQVILFGGQYLSNVTSGKGANATYKLENTYSNVTWAYQSGVWTKVTTGSSIPKMAGSSSAYYPSSKEVLLFGGINNGTVFNETWGYTGFTWTQIRTPVSPSAMYDTSMSYSTSLGAVLMFGGKTASGYSNSTWIFKNGLWTNLTSAGSMPHLAGAAMGSMGNGNLVLFGGFNGTSYSSSTYIFNGTTMKWSKDTVSTAPPALAFAHMNYFSFNNDTILFGGVSSSGNPYGNTWIFNSLGTWSESSAPAPYTAYGQAMTHYGANNTIVLFGGTQSNTTSGYNNYTFQFQNNTFNWVLFNENGLPSNTTWGVQVGNTFNNTTSSQVGFLVEQGTYNYTILSPSGYQATSGTNFTMYFSETNVTVSFSTIPGLLYYSYGAIAGIAIVILALVGEVVYRKIFH